MTIDIEPKDDAEAAWRLSAGQPSLRGFTEFDGGKLAKPESQRDFWHRGQYAIR